MDFHFLIFNFFGSIFLFYIFSKKNISKFLPSFLLAYDEPNYRKIHKKKISIMGGVVIFFLLLINSFFFQIFNRELLILSTLFFIVGYLDDKISLGSLTRLGLLSLFLAIFFLNNEILNISHLHIEGYGLIKLEYSKIFFSTLCVLLFLNSMNMIDGINGLSSGIFLTIIFFLLYKVGPDPLLLVLTLILIVFFIFNLNGKIFIGDSGIYFLSLILSLKIIEFSNLNLLYSEEIFLMMIIPGVDMLRMFVIRIIAKKNPFTADRKHIHHLILKKYNSLKTLIIILALALFPLTLRIITDFHSIQIGSITILIYLYLVHKFSN